MCTLKCSKHNIQVFFIPASVWFSYIKWQKKGKDYSTYTVWSYAACHRKHWRRKFCVCLKGFGDTQNALTLTTHPCGEHTPARSNMNWSQLSPSPFLLYSGAAISAAPSSYNQQIIWRALSHTSCRRLPFLFSSMLYISASLKLICSSCFKVHVLAKPLEYSLVVFFKKDLYLKFVLCFCRNQSVQIRCFIFIFLRIIVLGNFLSRCRHLAYSCCIWIILWCIWCCMCNKPTGGGWAGSHGNFYRAH